MAHAHSEATGIPTWLERDKQQLEDQELAEELMSTNYDPPCTTSEDESTYKYLQNYYYKWKIRALEVQRLERPFKFQIIWRGSYALFI